MSLGFSLHKVVYLCKILLVGCEIILCLRKLSSTLKVSSLGYNSVSLCGQMAEGYGPSFSFTIEDQRVFKPRENAIDLTLKLYINLAVHSLLLVRFPMDCLQLFPVCYSQAFSGLFVSRELESSRNIFFVIILVGAISMCSHT